MKLSKKILQRLIKEALGALITITNATTVGELLEMKLIKQSQVDAWNTSSTKTATKVAAKSLAEGMQKRANMAVAFYLGMTYGLVPEGVTFHDVRKDKDDQGKKLGFGLKATEKALNTAGFPNARALAEQAYKDLMAAGAITNNRGDVSNNAHVRHGRLMEFVDAENQYPLDDVMNMIDIEPELESDISLAQEIYFIKDYELLVQVASC